MTSRLFLVALLMATTVSAHTAFAKFESDADDTNHTHVFQQEVMKRIVEFRSDKVAELLTAFKNYVAVASNHRYRLMNFSRNQLSLFLMSFSQGFKFADVRHSEAFPDPKVLDAVADFIAYSAMHSADGFRHQVADYLLDGRAALNIRVAIVQHLQEDLMFDIHNDSPIPTNTRWRPTLRQLLAWTNVTVVRFLEKHEIELARSQTYEPIQKEQEQIKMDSGYFESTGCSPFLLK